MRGTSYRPRNDSAIPRFIPACAGNIQCNGRVPIATAVHPRVCGEHFLTGTPTSAGNGSSPRVRGTFAPGVLRQYRRRFIPACAGNIYVLWATRNRRSVHPRVCGEHIWCCACRVPTHGSSPRVRGTFANGNLGKRLLRFIPACAGNMNRRVGRRQIIAVHPRVCGEHTLSSICRISPAGSSPRVRGTCSPGTNSRMRSRFIPECAGNITKKPAPFGVPAVHPRVCGEHYAWPFWLSSRYGSSPRVRGTSRCSPPVLPLCRFIPACAGNIVSLWIRLSYPAVHPRVCGEHNLRQRAGGVFGGSSPRVRGTSRNSCDFGSLRRFIPACAGNIVFTVDNPLPIPVHPRVCGEHTQPEQRATPNAGSSPRVRGTSRLDRWPATLYRFIPACAGNMSWRSLSTPTATVHPRVCGEHPAPT